MSGTGSDGKRYSAQFDVYEASETLKLSIAKGRTVTLNGYRGNEYMYTAYEADGSAVEVTTGMNPCFGSITGAANSKLIMNGGYLALNGKISGLDVLVVENGAKLVTTNYSTTGKLPAMGLTANTLTVTDSQVQVYNGAVSVKTATFENSSINCDSFTANELTFEGDDTDINGVFATSGTKGVVNIKKVNVNSNSENLIEGRLNSKGVTQMTINAVSFADGFEDNQIQIGLQYATNYLYAAFYNGQIVINCPASVSPDAFTLVYGVNDATEGHMCGDQGTDWEFGRGTGNKNIVFKTIAH